MKLYITIPGRGFSVNAAYTRNHALTAAARRWKLNFHKAMMQYADECALFSRAFCPYKHQVKMTIINKMPNLFTKDGRVSHASVDTDNLNKLTIDGIFSFLPAIDDCAVFPLFSDKAYSKEESIVIELELLEFTLPLNKAA